MKRKLFVLAAVISSIVAQAQDWQIGGGAYNNGGFSIGADEEQLYEPVKINKSENLFNGGHEDAPVSLSVGYVNKNWSTDFGDYTWKENMWGQRNKRLHGFQIGLGYQPCLPVGLGIRTGAFFEVYLSEADGVKDQGFDSFTESNLYIPLHAMYRLPLAREASISVYGGLGINWAIYGEYTNHGYTYYDPWTGDSYYDGPHMEQDYGRNKWPRHLNFQTEVGCELRIKNYKIGATFSQGLTNHRFYRNHKTLQNKFSLSVGYVTDL